MNGLLARLQRLWPGLFGGAGAPAAAPSRAFPRAACPRCGLLVAKTRNGQRTWPHWCVDGYGVVDGNGHFHVQPRRRMPVLPLKSEPGQ